MRDGSARPPAGPGQSLWPQRQVQFARGHWRREEGAVRSAGWWESVTVTWSPAPGPERRPALRRALATAADAIAPAVAELAAAGALRLLERQRRARPALSWPRPVLPRAPRPRAARPRAPWPRRALPSAARGLSPAGPGPVTAREPGDGAASR